MYGSLKDIEKIIFNIKHFNKDKKTIENWFNNNENIIIIN